MAKTIKRIAALIFTLGFIIGSMTVSFADNSATKIFNGDGSGNNDKAPFDKQNISVQIGEQSYGFDAQGSGTWVRAGVHEFNLGDGGSLPVIITAADGSRYEANLTNHSNYTGNDGDAHTGTDNYTFSGIKQIINQTPSGGEQPGGEQPGGEQPGGEQPGGQQPGGEQPGGEQPGGQQPGGEQPGGEQPGGEQPGGEQPGGEQPGGQQPGGEQPGGEQPGGQQPYYPVVPTNEPGGYYPVFYNYGGGGDGLVEILDEEVPLAAVPQTGDVTALWLALSVLSGSGLAIVSKKRKS